MPFNTSAEAVTCPEVVAAVVELPPETKGQTTEAAVEALIDHDVAKKTRRDTVVIIRLGISVFLLRTFGYGHSFFLDRELFCFIGKNLGCYNRIDVLECLPGRASLEYFENRIKSRAL